MFGNIQEATMKEMVWSNSLNRLSKYVIPLLDDNLSREDICIDTGFVNAYSIDTNRPWHANCIFLLYKVVNTIESVKTFSKLRKLDTLKTWYPLKIDGNHYSMFVFQRCNSKYIKQFVEVGTTFRSTEALGKFCKFWKDFSIDDIRPFTSTRLQDCKPMRYTTPIED